MSPAQIHNDDYKDNDNFQWNLITSAHFYKQVNLIKNMLFGVHVCCLFTVLDHITDFHKIWYKCYAFYST